MLVADVLSSVGLQAARAVGRTVASATTRPAAPTATQASAADRLELSTDGLGDRQIERLGRAQRLAVKAKNENAPVLETQRQSARQRLSAFEQRLREALQERGIESSGNIELHAQDDGQIVVSGDHPRLAEIQQFLDNHHELRDELAKLSIELSELNLAEETAAFARAWDRDPESAARRYERLIDGAAPQKPTLVLSETAASIRFDGQ